MIRRSGEKRWESKFGQLIHRYGVEKLAEQLGMEPSAIYHWISGSNSLKPTNALRIQRLAMKSGIKISLDEIYLHFCEVGSEGYRASQLKPQPAGA